MMPKNSDWPMRFLLIALAAVILIMLITYYSNKSKTENEKFFQAPSPTFNEAQSPSVYVADSSAQSAVTEEEAGSYPMPSEPASNEDYLAVDYSNSPAQQQPTQAACFPKDKPLSAEDLLPADAANSKWSQVNPAGQGSLKDVQLLTAGFHMGVNTVGQTLRNPNLQIRSEPPNPKIKVSPWNQTTIEYDGGRRFFELGEC